MGSILQKFKDISLRVHDDTVFLIEASFRKNGTNFVLFFLCKDILEKRRMCYG